ncbi:MAG: hypothetical protein GY906_08490, partial [bacterium]|nr:hypothetical protein [bacterium]
MIPTSNLIVISDLHLAPQADRSPFQAGDALCHFLSWVLNDQDEHTQFVVAGDAFEFLLPGPDGACLDVLDHRRSPEHMRSIIDSHDPIFAAL